jgi:hypothetical protein
VNEVLAKHMAARKMLHGYTINLAIEEGFILDVLKVLHAAAIVAAPITRRSTLSPSSVSCSAP